MSNNETHKQFGDLVSQALEGEPAVVAWPKEYSEKSTGDTPTKPYFQIPNKCTCLPETLADNDSDVWCTQHGEPSLAYDVGYENGREDAIQVTPESVDRAAKFLYRKDAPPGEPADAWETSAPEERKEIYRRSAAMIARLYNGQVTVVG